MSANVDPGMKSQGRVNLPLLIGEVAFLAVMFGLILFGTAGTLAWPAAWLYLLCFFAPTVVITVWLARHDPGLLTERMTGQAKGTRGGQKGWDLLFTVVANLLFIGWFALMGLDAVRFGWSNVPNWLQAVGALLVVGSFRLFFAVFRANSFLSPVVRVQEERGQTVVDTGPYAVVRHPMYAAVIPFALGTSLLLGSWWGLLPAAALMLVIAWRAVQEERTLRAELPGYVEYAARVRYRLVPGVW